MEAKVKGSCPVCGREFGSIHEITHCAKCVTPHHKECWGYNKGCAIYACGHDNARHQFLNPPPTSRLMQALMWPMVLCLGNLMAVIELLSVGVVKLVRRALLFLVVCAVAYTAFMGGKCVSSNATSWWKVNEREWREEAARMRSFVPKKVEEKINNVCAVNMHQVGEYSIAYSDTVTSSELKIRRLVGGDWNLWSEPVFKILRDVPRDEMMWVRITGKIHEYRTRQIAEKVEIHVHSIRDIQGAGWNRRVGKSGSVQEHTNVIDSE